MGRSNQVLREALSRALGVVFAEMADEIEGQLTRHPDTAIHITGGIEVDQKRENEVSIKYQVGPKRYRSVKVPGR